MSKKKQNAIIFAICVLLASSASVGIKTKEKKEKEQIKQELNNVLIPNAEKKLDSLITTRNLLHDSVVYFQNELISQSQYTQIKKQIPKITFTLSLLENITNQWHRAYSMTEKHIAAYPEGDKIPENLQQKHLYLTNNMILEPVLHTKRFDFIAEYLINTLEAYLSCFDYHNTNNVHQEPQIINNIYETLHNVKDLLSAIDPSQNIIDKQNIKFLKQQINILLDDFAKLQNESNIETTVTELNRIKRNRAETDYQLRQQMKKLAQLKTNYAVDELYKQRKK